MEDRVKTIVVSYELVSGTRRASNCTFCGRSGMVSNYVAGVYVVQLCERCTQNPPGAVKVIGIVTEEKPETKKKKQFSR